jgi:hypothetical protein
MPKATIDPESGGSNTVALDSHALGTLQYIRASIDAAGLLAVPGSAGIAMGAVGITAHRTGLGSKRWRRTGSRSG